MSELSIIVVNYGTPRLLGALVGTLAAHSDRRLVRELIVVDNGFPDRGDSRTVIRPAEYPFPISFVQNPDTSYSSGINRGAEAAQGAFLAAANSDLEWRAECRIGPLLDAMNDPTVGVAGPQLLFPDGDWQRSHAPFPSLREAISALVHLEVLRGAAATYRLRRCAPPGRPKDVEYVVGAFMVIRRACFDTLRGMDERFGFYADDADFCWRAAQAGWRRLFVPAARLIHLKGASSAAHDNLRYARTLFAAKHAFVAHHFGEEAAHRYARLIGIAVRQRAGLYRAIGLLVRTPAWRQRMQMTRDDATAIAQLFRRDVDEARG